MTQQAVSQYATIKKLAQDGRLGAVQTISVTVNGRPERAREEIAEIIDLVGTRVKDIRYVVSTAPYAHGALTMVFENEVLARYVITCSPASERTDWHVYCDKTELDSRAEDGNAKIIPADLFPNVECVGFIAADRTAMEKLPAEAEKFCRALCGE